MAESGNDVYNAHNLLRPLEQGVVEKFDKLFTAREKTLKHWMAQQILRKQEFLTHTFPTIIKTGAENPQLAGGVLYMLGLLTQEVKNGPEAINSIPRRFAEQLHTKKNKELRPILHNIHIKESATIPVLPPEQTRIVNQEVTRARLTKELYALEKKYVDVSYTKDGKTIDLGNNGSLCSILNKDSQTGKTMVFLCASGSDPPSAESFVVNYAMRTGDKVYVIGQPDGDSGSMTPQFADAVFGDANPPNIDLFKKFQPPTYKPHTEYFRAMIHALIAPNEQFDLYAHSAGSMYAKNLLQDPSFSNRVTNAVLLNPAGAANFDTRFPFLFRTLAKIRLAWPVLFDLRHLARSTYEIDKDEKLRTPSNRFRDRVRLAIQGGSHWRQPGWDTMHVNGGNIILYVGAHDGMTDGRQFAKFITPRIEAKPTQTILEYDSIGHHTTLNTHPERVLDAIFRHLPDRNPIAHPTQTASKQKTA